MHRLHQAFNLFDNYNKQDPRAIIHNGVSYPSEYFYALQLHDRIKGLAPQASETLLLASRCQHIGRWQMPREGYPQTRAGYLTWRKELAGFHAAKAGELLLQAGYDEQEIKAVRHILLKENVKRDPDVQVMENALCLVFLRFQFENFIQEHEEAKVVRILQKSWGKMDEGGRKAALILPFSDKGSALLQKALNQAT